MQCLRSLSVCMLFVGGLLSQVGAAELDKYGGTTAIKGEADVYRIPTNAKNSAYGLKQLDKRLTETSIKWDVVHCNWGLWDLRYRHPESKAQDNRDKINGTLTESLEAYRANMNKIVARLKQTDATLIWCTMVQTYGAPYASPEFGAGKGLAAESEK